MSVSAQVKNHLSLRNAMLRPVAKEARMATGFLRKPIPAYARGRRY
jgi:hypothetical protein